MMKNISVALLALVFSVAAVAADKVAVINMQAAIMQTKSAQKSLQTLEANADYAAMKAEFESLRADMISLNKNAQKNSVTWTDKQKAEHRKQMEYKAADMKLIEQKLKAESGSVVQSIMQAQGAKAKAALQDLVKEEGIGLLLDSSVAYYADKNYDLTAKLTAKLNKAK
ncbi:OmpH family outer membrane protein [Pseudomaricurvus hydrocarbonicus]|nr:OmpH family outer membrane protein [Aestuariicella hydrocarbonica]